jgi:type IV secretory pathway component VirB8
VQARQQQVTDDHEAKRFPEDEYDALLRQLRNTAATSAVIALAALIVAMAAIVVSTIALVHTG